MEITKIISGQFAQLLQGFRWQICLLIFLSASSLFSFGQDTLATQQATRPNILLIVADDLGYSDIAPFGGEIHTPILSKLAAQSMLFSNFHALPMCAPTRAVLLTGTDNHLAGLGAQQGAATEEQARHKGYEGYLNEQVAALPEVLQAVGYRTYQSGKWHLGHDISNGPHSKGFQENFSLLSGGASHYADQIPLYPLVPPTYTRNGQRVVTLPKDFYSSKNYTDSLLSWLERDKNQPTPFFAYLAYTAPHDPLHAPKAYIEKYKGQYDAGYETLRSKRFNQLKKLGYIPEHQPLPEWPKVVTKWDALSDLEKQYAIRDMETYAAMVDYMDEQIGRVYNWLEAEGALDNTLILFMSDNGANGTNPSKIYPEFAGEFEAQFDQSLDNRGLPNSFTHMGAGWATASTAAFKFFKTLTTQGGLRTNCFLKPPKSSLPSFLPAHNATFTHVKDLMPTLLEIAAVPHPSLVNEQLEKMQGKSLLPILRGAATSMHEGEGIGYELHGGKAFFKDDWKIVQSPMPLGNADWELYNIKEDPAESNNLIFSQRTKFKELLSAYQAYEKANGVIFDLPLIFGKIAKAFQVIFCLLIALFGLAIVGKLSGKLKQKYIDWGYGTTFMYALAFTELIAAIGLFTHYNWYAAWFLLAIMGGAFLTIIRHQENWKAYLLPLLTTILLGLFLLLKSEILLGWLLR